MSKELSVEIVTSNFNRMLADLAGIDAAVEFRSVVRHEAVKVVEKSLSYTRAARVASIRAGQAAKEWTTFNGKKYHIAEWYLPDKLWAAIQAKRRATLQRKLNARGLSKQSWLHMARQLGGTIAAPAYVDRANYDGKQYPIDADSLEEGRATNYALTIINSSPIVQAAGGQSALLRAMNGRARYFERNMAHHAFRTLATRARAYPGIWTSPVPLRAD